MRVAALGVGAGAGLRIIEISPICRRSAFSEIALTMGWSALTSTKRRCDTSWMPLSDKLSAVYPGNFLALRREGRGVSGRGGVAQAAGRGAHRWRKPGESQYLEGSIAWRSSTGCP